MRLEEQAQPGALLVQGYGSGGFRLAGQRHEGSLMILPTGPVGWPVVSAEGITLAQLEPVMALADRIDILLVGCGLAMRPVDRALAESLRQSHGISVDFMDTGAACRTFNVLMMEGRQVAAALIAVP
jgi:uncharacterized protein